MIQDEFLARKFALQIISRARADTNYYSSQVQFAITFVGSCSVGVSKSKWQHLPYQACETLGNINARRQICFMRRYVLPGRKKHIIWVQTQDAGA